MKGCRCQCAVCGEYFGSERAFDRHRVGEYGTPGQWQDTRRCLRLAEMLAAGWQRSAGCFLIHPDPRRAGAGVASASVTLPPTEVQGALARGSNS